MVLAAGVSAFHTSAAAGLCWQQLLSLYKPLRSARCHPAHGDRAHLTGLAGTGGGGKLGRGGMFEYSAQQSFILGGFLLCPETPVLQHTGSGCSFLASVAAAAHKNIASPFLPLCPISLLFSPPARGHKGLDQ